MATKQTTTCDRCNREAPSSEEGFTFPERWLMVLDGQAEPLHFCTWGCLTVYSRMKYAVDLAASNPLPEQS